MSEENKYILQVKDLHTSFATDAGGSSCGKWCLL